MKIGISITIKIEICYEALAGPLLPSRPVSFPENLRIPTRYPWGIWGPTDSPLRVGLYRLAPSQVFASPQLRWAKGSGLLFLQCIVDESRKNIH